MKFYHLNLFLILSVIFTSCNIDGYGKKVKVSDRIEVFIKNDATETDAKKMGNYFDSTWKDQTNEKSFQLSKDSGNYTVRMVVDEDQVKKDSTLNVSFMAIQFLLEEKVFTGSKVKLILTDNKFNDFKTFESHSYMINADDKMKEDSNKTDNQ